jgi:hypothetical protein
LGIFLGAIGVLTVASVGLKNILRQIDQVDALSPD